MQKKLGGYEVRCATGPVQLRTKFAFKEHQGGITVGLQAIEDAFHSVP